MLNEKTFYDLSLLSYFQCMPINASVSTIIVSILQNEQLAKDYENNPTYLPNREALGKVDIDDYQDMYLRKIYDDNSNSGVVYYIFETLDVLIVVFRGSEALDDVHHTTGWQDWSDNFEMFLKGPSHQQLVAHQCIQHEKITKSFYMCGHSKGGNLALFVALTMKEKLLEQLIKVYSFNAPGITKSILATYESRANNASFLKKIELFENENDCISSFFENLNEPHYIKSILPCNNLTLLYHNHNLYAMDFERNAYILAEKKTAIPKMVYHFINNFFMNLKEERLIRIVAHMEDYFRSDLSLNELYKVFIYHISQYTSLFEDISYEEVKTITFQDLIDRRKTKNLMAKVKDFQPRKITSTISNLHPVARFNDVEIKAVTQGFIENYELMIKEKTNQFQEVIAQNNLKIRNAIRDIRNHEKEH